MIILLVGSNNDEMGPASKLNAMPKYVVSTTMQNAGWNNTQQINHLKKERGEYILMESSASLVGFLMQ